MPELDLDAIRARADAATRGPWRVEYFGDRGYPQRIANDAAVLVADTHEGGGRAPTAEFIAAARDDVPALVAEVERYQRLFDEGSFPSSEAFESMANAMQAYRDLAEEMLRHFSEGSYGVDLVVSKPVPIETVTRWRRVPGGESR